VSSKRQSCQARFKLSIITFECVYFLPDCLNVFFWFIGWLRDALEMGKKLIFMSLQAFEAVLKNAITASIGLLDAPNFFGSS